MLCNICWNARNVLKCRFWSVWLWFNALLSGVQLWWDAWFSAACSFFRVTCAEGFFTFIVHTRRNGMCQAESDACAEYLWAQADNKFCFKCSDLKYFIPQWLQDKAVRPETVQVHKNRCKWLAKASQVVLCYNSFFGHISENSNSCVSVHIILCEFWDIV